MNAVHKVTNGAGEVKGWAVVANGAELIGTYDSIEEACRVADSKDSENTLAALKTLPNYSKTAVQVVMAETGFATEEESALALWKNGWDVNKAVNALLFA